MVARQIMPTILEKDHGVVLKSTTSSGLISTRPKPLNEIRQLNDGFGDGPALVRV